MEFPDIVGLIGVIMILVAYFLLEVGKITMHSLAHPLLNFVGALLIIFSLLYQFNLPAMAMESAWAAVSIMGIRRVYKSRQSQKAP